MTIADLKKWILDSGKIAIWCAGKIGLVYYEVLKRAGMKVDCFFDNNLSIVGTEVMDGCFCENAEHVCNKDDYVVFIGISECNYCDVELSVREKGFNQIIEFNEIFDDIICNYPELFINLITVFQELPSLDAFYVRKPNKNNKALVHDAIAEKKIAVYTGIFGNYDCPCPQFSNVSNIDYYFISDFKPQNCKGYTWIDAKTIIPYYITSPIKRNRYIKMHPHLIFHDYDYSIYIDGNVKLKQDISSFIRKSNSGISTFMHPRRDCIYYEAITIVNCKRVLACDVETQVRRYLNEGMPLHYGLPEMTVIAREHNNPLCIKIMDEWWNEFNNGAQRDQLSFMYVLWKNHLNLSDISSLGDDVRNTSFLELRPHQYISQSIKNVL